MPSTRRGILGVAGSALAGFAGCIAPSGGNGTGSESATAEPAGSPSPADPTEGSTTPRDPAAVGETVTVDGATVSIAEVGVQSSVQYLDSPDSMDVTAEDGVWYVFATIEASAGESGDLPTAADFELAVDGGEHDGTTVPGFDTDGVDGWETQYDPEADGEGWIGFAVQADAPGADPRIALGDASWRLGEDAVERLAGPKPTFELVSFEVPETVEARESFAATVTARNAGDVPGTFRGVLNVEGGVAAYAPYPYDLDLDVGEEATWTEEFGTDVTRPGATMRHHLRTPAGDRDVVTEVSGTPTEEGD